MDKYLREEIAEMFDNFRKEVIGALTDTFKAAKEGDGKIDYIMLIEKIPQTSYKDLTKAFNDAEERLKAEKPKKKKGIFG